MKNIFRIKVPAQNKEKLMSDLLGPLNFWLPEEVVDPSIKATDLTPHDRMEAEALRKEAQAAYSSLPSCPAWYRVTIGDILHYMDDPALLRSVKRVPSPISYAKVRPWANEQEYNAWISASDRFSELIYGFPGPLSIGTESEWRENHYDSFDTSSYIDSVIHTHVKPIGAPLNAFHKLLNKHSADAACFAVNSKAMELYINTFMAGRAQRIECPVQCDWGELSVGRESFDAAVGDLGLENGWTDGLPL